MDENYPRFLSSVMAGAEAHIPISPEEFNNPLLPAPTLPISHQRVSYEELEDLSAFKDSSPFPLNPPKVRQKLATAAAPDTEQVKHRRTRSGCFTCRSRRVKCDEARPICERCRKGGRDCVYPDSSSTKGSSRQKEAVSNTSSNQSPSPSNSDDVGHEDAKPIGVSQTIAGDDESGDGNQAPIAQDSVKTNLELSVSDTPVSDTRSFSPPPPPPPPPSAVATSNTLGTNAEDFRSMFANDTSILQLSIDYQMYLQYFYENVTCYHYSLTNDTDNFFIRGMIIEASRNKGLLNAVVAFSAYLHGVETPGGKLRRFLLYYNRSVTFLLDCLKQYEAHNLPTLLSVLQLATIEEYLGDWLNLMGHQKAALELFTKLFTVETAMETRIGQICLAWYTRFDVGIALIGGLQPRLSRNWLTAAISYYRDKINQQPSEVRWKVEERLARLQLIRYDMSTSYFKVASQEMPDTNFVRDHEDLSIQLMNWKDAWDPALTSPDHVVHDYWWRRPADPDDIVDPYELGLLFSSPLLSSTIMAAEWHALVVLHKTQAIGVPREKLTADLARHSYSVCQLFEALEYWPETPKGVLACLRPMLSLAALFISRDARHRAWLGRKFALLETNGLIQPRSFRSKIRDIFNDAGATDWWLPSGEGLTPMLESIRNFADERHNAALNAQQDGIKETRSLLSRLNF